MIVIRDNLDLAAVDPACGVDLVGCKLGGERDRRAGDSLRFSNDADFDGVFRLRVCGRCECKRKEGVLGVKVRFRNVSSPEKYFNIISGRNYDHFYVTAANKKYFILKDSEGTYLTPSASGGGDLRVPLEQGARSVIRLISFTSAGGAGYFAHHVYCRPCSSRDIQTVKESIFTI